MKRVYVLKGSEDGVVGAFSSAAKAFSAAVAYAGDHGNSATHMTGLLEHKPGQPYEVGTRVSTSLPHFRKELLAFGIATVYQGDEAWRASQEAEVYLLDVD